MIKPQVSKSLMLDYGDYINEDMCGLVFEAKHITKTYPQDSTKATLLGEYVEWIVLDNVPERMKGTGKVPQPMRTQKGEMTADFQRAHDRAVKLKKLLFEDMKLEKVASGERITNDWGSGIIDCRLRGHFFGTKKNGEPETITMDLKYSGLMDDQWSRYGFAFDGFKADAQKAHHGKQGKQYTLLTGDRFFLGVLSSQAPPADPDKDKEKKEDIFRFEFIELVADPEALMAHRDEALYIRDRVNIEASIGFKAHPDFNRCEVCGLREKCKVRAVLPTKRVVNLTSNE